MELALPHDSGRYRPESPAGATQFSPLYKRMMVAGVAVAGASVIAVTPTAQTAQTLTAIQARAVQLSAFADPFTTLQTALQTSAEHVQYGLNTISTLYPELLQQTLDVAPDAFTELGTALTNAEGWQQVMAKLPEYSAAIQAALDSASNGASEGGDQGGGLSQLPTVLQNVATYLAAGKFSEAYTEVNDWFLWSLGYGGGWEAMKVLHIPGEILKTLGATRLGTVSDALLSEKMLGLYATSVLTPFIGATFQATEILDEVAIAAQAQDWETAASGLVNLPAKVLGAYLNGHVPSFAYGDWPGALTKGGTLETFLFTIPREITWALTNPIPLTTTETQASTADVTSATIAPSDALVTLDVDPATESASAAPTSKLASKLAANLKALAPVAAVTEVATDVVDPADATAVPATTEPVATAPVDEAETVDDTAATALAVKAETSTATKPETATAVKADTTTAAKPEASTAAKPDTATSVTTKSDSSSTASTASTASTDKADTGSAGTKSEGTKARNTKPAKSKSGATGSRGTSATKSGAHKSGSDSHKSGSKSGSKSGGSSGSGSSE
ncbi:hypothetical protein FR943_13575 [Mycobacterium sp. TNTM28]|uniref:PE-PGRS family protein n=1 Tax=[Mycobacterium] fortunisiensis TaxID=2600579 RepID=A0ABS6KMS9_9MYCO|nr:hypothetical protein [[Mycobacterium] fortunisiensis]MBU9764867.1 hypothetical protein [[Mycobacterium] fortunisiensis]